MNHDSSDNPSQNSRNTAQTQTREVTAFTLQPGDVVAGRYRVESGLGVGAMGEVVKAHDLQLDVPVALKVMRTHVHDSDTALQRFRQELLTARRVSHPNVVRLHDIIQDGDRWILSMDFVAGESLQQRLAREGALEHSLACQIAGQVAQGLEAAHQAGVIHRDLKPANILLTDNGSALIADFGIARSLSHAGLTREGAMVGTPEYLSPEQAAGDDIDARSDLYALGLIFAEMLTGALPFKAATAQESIGQRLTRSPEPLKDIANIPDHVMAACHGLLRKEPQHRLASANTFLRVLNGADKHSSRRRPWLNYGVLGLVVLGAVGIGVWQWFSISENNSDTVASQAFTKRSVLFAPVISSSTISQQWKTGMLLDALKGPTDLQPVGYSRLDTALRLSGFSFTDIAEHHTRLMKTLDVETFFLIDFQGGAEARNSTENTEILAIAGLTSEQWASPEWLAVLAQQLPPNWRVDSGFTPLNALQSGANFYQGLLHLQQGNAINAVPLLQDSVQENPEFAGAYWALAWAYSLTGQYDDAEDTALQAGALASDKTFYGKLARVWQHLTTGDYAQADALMSDLIDTHPGHSLILLVGAEYFGDAGEFARASELLDILLDQYPENARAWFLRAKFAILRGDSQLALDQYLIQAQSLHTRLQNNQGLADTINAQGIAYEQLGDIDQAYQKYQQAANLRASIGDVRGEAATLRNLAALASIRGEQDKARAYLEEAETQLLALGDLAGIADLNNDAGVLAEERGEYRQAYQYFRDALDLRRQLPNSRNIAESLTNVGYVSLELGEYARAQAYLSQALQMSSDIDDLEGQVHAGQNLALLEIARGDYDTAQQRLEQAEHQAQSLQMRQELAVNAFIHSRLALYRGDYAQALAQARVAEQGFLGMDDARGTASARLHQARVLENMEQDEQARSILTALQPDELNAAQQAESAILLAKLALSSGDSALATTHLQAIETDAAVSQIRRDLLLLQAQTSEVGFGFAELAAQSVALGHQDLILQTHTIQATMAKAEQAHDVVVEVLQFILPMLDAQPSRWAIPLLNIAITYCPVADRPCADLQQLLQRQSALNSKDGVNRDG